MHRSIANLPSIRYRGFSFVEVMFAVIILGIGFIMVSAMFPVAIQQTQMNVDDAATNRVAIACETNFNALAQDMANYTKSVTNGAVSSSYYGWPMTRLIPAPAAIGTQTTFYGAVYSFRDSRWNTTNYTADPTIPAAPIAPQPSYLWPFYNATTGTLAANYPSEFPLFSSTPAPAAPIMQIGLWDRIRGGMIMSAEPQYAYVPLFQHGYSYNASATAGSQFTASSQVNLYAFIAAARNRAPYTYTSNNAVQSDVMRNPYANGDTGNALPAYPPAPASLEPRLVQVLIYPRNGAQILDNIVIEKTTIAGASAGDTSYLAAGSGGYVIISDDGTANGAFNGRIYRLGASTTLIPPLTAPASSSTWELQPGSDVSPGDLTAVPPLPTGTVMQAYILGRELRNPDLKYDPSNNPYDGPVQDLAVQTFTIQTN